MTVKKGFIAKYAKIMVIIAVLCGAMSGSLGALIKAPALAMGFWRLTISLPFFIIPSLLSSKKREELKSLEPKSWVLCVLSGLFLFLHFYCWFSAVKITNIASAAVLASLHPLVVVVITVFIYKKKVSVKSLIAIIIALIGGAIIMGGDLNSLYLEGQTLGNLFAFLSGASMGIYFAIGGKARENISGNNYVMLVFLFCWLFFIMGCDITKTRLFGYSTHDYFLLFVMAMVCQIGSHALWNMCLGNVSSLYISTWEAGDPVFTTIVAFVLVGQIPKDYEIIGCIVVVGALLFYNKFERENHVQG